MRFLVYGTLFAALAVFSSLVQKFGGRQFTLGVTDQIVTLASYGCLTAAGVFAGLRRADLVRLIVFLSPMIGFILSYRPFGRCKPMTPSAKRSRGGCFCWAC